MWLFLWQLSGFRNSIVWLYVFRLSRWFKEPKRSSQEGGIMCRHKSAALLTSFVLALAGFFLGPAQAQINPARPAVQDPAPKPIGKVVTASGSVTIERANAAVIQVNLPRPAHTTKVRDIVL